MPWASYQCNSALQTFPPPKTILFMKPHYVSDYSAYRYRFNILNFAYNLKMQENLHLLYLLIEIPFSIKDNRETSLVSQVLMMH